MSEISAKHKEINRNIFYPKLRFVNFSKEWNEINFGNTFNFKQTNSLSRDKLNYEVGKVKNIHYGDIHTKFHSNFYIDNENVPYINKDIDLNKIDPENYCKENDLIIADASEDYLDVGKSIEIRNLDNQKVLSGLHTLIARPKSNYFSQGILGYLMRSRTVRLQIMILAQGTKVLGISPKYLNKIIFKLPEIPEQQKIAEFLELADSWIENLKEQKKTLEKYKKSMMQKIFAQEIRFKDENEKEFNKWERNKIEDISVCLDNQRKPLNGSERNKMKGIIPYWGANNIMDYVNDYLFNETIILLAEDCGNFDEFKDKPIAHISYGKCWVNNHTHVLKAKESFISSVFFYFSLVHKNITAYVNGDARQKLNQSDMLNIKVDVPCFSEQQKIAEFLTSIDNLINSKQQQIAKAEEWKKGLMQGLFV